MIRLKTDTIPDVGQCIFVVYFSGIVCIYSVLEIVKGEFFGSPFSLILRDVLAISVQYAHQVQLALSFLLFFVS